MQEALETAPKLALAHQLAAAIAIKAQDDSQAQRHLHDFLDLQPDNVEGWLSLGNSYRRSTPGFGAGLPPGSSRPDLLVRQRLQRLLFMNRATARTCPSQKRAFAITPRTLASWQLLGEVLLESEAFEEALERFDSALSHRPDVVAAARQGPSSRAAGPRTAGGRLK